MPGKEKQEKSLRERDEAFAKKFCFELGCRVGLSNPTEKVVRLTSISTMVFDGMRRMVDDIKEEVLR